MSHDSRRQTVSNTMTVHRKKTNTTDVWPSYHSRGRLEKYFWPWKRTIACVFGFGYSYFRTNIFCHPTTQTNLEASWNTESIVSLRSVPMHCGQTGHWLRGDLLLLTKYRSRFFFFFLFFLRIWRVQRCGEVYRLSPMGISKNFTASKTGKIKGEKVKIAAWKKVYVDI